MLFEANHINTQKSYQIHLITKQKAFCFNKFFSWLHEMNNKKILYILEKYFANYIFKNTSFSL